MDYGTLKSIMVYGHDTYLVNCLGYGEGVRPYKCILLPTPVQTCIIYLCYQKLYIENLLYVCYYCVVFFYSFVTLQYRLLRNIGKI